MSTSSFNGWFESTLESDPVHPNIDHPELKLIDQLLAQLQAELDRISLANPSHRDIQVATLNMRMLLGSCREQLLDSLDRKVLKLF